MSGSTNSTTAAGLLAKALRLAGHVTVATALAIVLGACSPPGTDGIDLVDASPPDESRVLAVGDTVNVELVYVPAIRLPDLSAVDSYDDLLDERLGALELRPIDGVEVVEGTCADGETVYTGDESSDVFDDADIGFNESFTFEIDPDNGAATYQRDSFEGDTRITTNGDGSGEFVDKTFDVTLSIEAFGDGSGHYYREERGGAVVTVDAANDGSGVFTRELDDDLLTVTLRSDGSGALYSLVGEEAAPAQLLTIDAKPDGSGDLYFEQQDRVVTLRVRSDKSWEYADRSYDRAVSVLVRADGSGQYRERGSANVTLDFAADGASDLGPQVHLPATPSFVVSDAFPNVGTLAAIEAPCATVLRFDSALLFDVNEATVLPAASAVLANVAPALIEADRSIEINGHTDATGSESYNQELSERRAQAVADELRALGVDVEMTVTGFGESQPVADNFGPDGSDDLAGQRQNRRVELVING